MQAKTKNSRVLASIGGAWITTVKDRPGFYLCWNRPKKNGKAQSPGRKSLGEVSLDVAEAKLAEHVAQHGRLDKQADADANIGIILKAYYARHIGTKEWGPIAKSGIDKIIADFGHLSVADLNDREHVTKFIAAERARKIVDASINRYLTNLIAGLNWARKKGMLTRRPPEVFKIPEGEFEQQEPDVDHFTIEQLVRLVQLARTQGRKALFRSIVIQIATLCRPGAPVRGLTPRQINFEGDRIDLNKSGRAQNRKWRPLLRLPAAFKPLLREWIAEDNLGPDDSFVLSNDRRHAGKPVKRIRDPWKRIVYGKKGLGLTGTYTPYSIRHTLATLLNARDVPEAQIEIQLGHRKDRATSNKTTGRYAKHRPDYQADATDVLNEVLTLCLNPVDSKVVPIKARKKA